MAERYDVIVVGAGASGGVAAARLSEDPDCKLLLLESGPDFPEEAERLPLFAVSGEHSWLVSGLPEFDWNFADCDLDGRRSGRTVRLPRGRLVGGSSMVNSTIAARPAPSDLDRWARLGNDGWSWQEILPWLKAIENDLDFGESVEHGGSGPIAIRRYREESWAPVNRVFADACSSFGIRHDADLNGSTGSAGCFGAMPHNRFKEVRLGTLVTYLRKARGRPNLTIRGQSHVDSVIVENGRSVGVRWIGAGGAQHEARAAIVLLCAGVYSTPAILQRSGIGPPELLRRLGIPVRCELPVGEHLMDHPGVAFFFQADGIAATTGRFFGANWRGEAGADGEPWWQTHPFPVDEEERVCGLWTYLCRQQATGTVHIASADPKAAPIIDHRYVASGQDIERFADAWRFNQALLATKPFAATGARWLEPELEIESYLMARLASAHHQSSTCRMGNNPRESVVSPELCVHGVEGLMIADSSVFPDTIMHNTNLLCYAIGEIAAREISAARGSEIAVA